MTSKWLIDDSIPIVSGEETIGDVLQKMEDFGLGALPLVDDNKLVTVLLEDILLEQLDDQIKVSSLPSQTYQSVLGSSHWYEAVSVFKKSNIELIPVADENQVFLGCIKSQRLLKKFTEMLTFKSFGAVIVLQIEERTFSLSDIARIIESNGSKLLSAALYQDDEVENLTYLVIKLDGDDASRVVAGLERFNHVIIARFQNTFYQNTDQERLNQFLRYINI